jgi:hypothetical protein
MLFQLDRMIISPVVVIPAGAAAGLQVPLHSILAFSSGNRSPAMTCAVPTCLQVPASNPVWTGQPGRSMANFTTCRI